MEMRQVRYFLAVASRQSFTRAAESLHLSQPSLSVQVAALEEELGSRLFDRLGKRVVLTQAGEVFLHHAERLLREADQAAQTIRELAGGHGGRLQVGAISTVNSYLVPPLVSEFRRRFPLVQLHVEALPSAEIVRSVTEGRLDLGLCLLPVASERLAVTRLFEERLVLVAPARDRTLPRRVRVRELAHLPLILMPADYCLRRMIEAECARAGVQPQVLTEMTAPDGILEAVRHGAGLTILPEYYLRRHLPAGALRLIELYAPVPRHPVGLIHQEGRHLGLPARGFLGLCRTVLAEFGPGPTPRTAPPRVALAQTR